MRSFQHALWTRTKFISLASLISFPSLAKAEEVNQVWSLLHPTVSARIAAFEQGKSAASQEPQYPAALVLAMKPEAFGGISSTLEAIVRGKTETNKNQAELREGYLEKSMGPINLKIGRQITVWGRADKMNPTDFLSTKDLRRLSSDDEEQRLGIASSQVAWEFGDGQLVAVWQHEWRRPLFPIFAATPGLTMQQLDPKDPNKQFALKWDQAGGKVDWSVSAFSGYNRNPDIDLKSVGPEGIELELVHHPIKALGADLAFNLFNIAWRGELAHTQTLDQDASEPLQQNASSFAVFGGDRNLAEGLNLNMQTFARWKEEDQESAAAPWLKAIKIRHQINTQQKRNYQDGLTLRLSQKLWQETLELEAAMVWNRQDGDRTYRPKVSYAWNDHLKSLIGAEINRGSADSFFGQLRPFSTAFAELRLSF